MLLLFCHLLVLGHGLLAEVIALIEAAVLTILRIKALAKAARHICKLADMMWFVLSFLLRILQFMCIWRSVAGAARHAVMLAVAFAAVSLLLADLAHAIGMVIL